MDFLSKRHLIQLSHSPCVSQALSPITSHHPSSTTNFPIIAIIVIGLFTTSFLLVSYYILVIKCCLNGNHVDIVRVRRFSLSQEASSSVQASEARGLEEAMIQLIPVIHYKKEGDIERSFCECAVCLNEFQEDEKLRVVPNCNHVFHIDCVDVWLQNNTSCPLCRRHISLTRETHVDELHTPRPSPQDETQTVENLIGRVEDFVVIDLDNEHDGDQNLQGRQERGKELELPNCTINPSHRKLELHKVTSMGDECIGVRAKDDGFLVQPMRRSFSMDSSDHRQFYMAAQQGFQQHNEVSSIEVCGGSNGKSKRSLFSFGHGSRSRNAVLPVCLDS